MKSLCLTSAMFLLALGTAHAQQPESNVTTTPLILEREVLPPPPPNPMLTAADSARERERVANAQALRKQATTPPAKVSTNVPLSPMTGEGATPPVDNSYPDLTERKRSRDQQEREMRKQALSKKGREQTKATNKRLKKLNQAGLTE